MGKEIVIKVKVKVNFWVGYTFYGKIGIRYESLTSVTIIDDNTGLILGIFPKFWYVKVG